jgi:hypothetical protein
VAFDTQDRRRRDVHDRDYASQRPASLLDDTHNHADAESLAQFIAGKQTSVLYGNILALESPLC